MVLSPRSETESGHIMNSNLSEEESVINKVYDDDDMNKPVIWIPNSDLVPKWGLVYEEYIAFCYGLLGGTLTCFSGWLIGRSIRHCIGKKQ